MKRTLKHFYDLDRTQSNELVGEICSGTRRSPSAVYMWIRGLRTPCYREQLYIKGVIKRRYDADVPLMELFPNQ